MKLLLSVLALLPLLSLQAADPATQLADRGKLLFSDDFSKLDTNAWKVAKGKWEIADGALRGAELAADKHGGVVRHLQPITDAVVQYEVRLDGAKTHSLSFNGAKGHICRVMVSPTGFSARKDDSDHQGPDTPVAFGAQTLPFKPGEWHTVVAEIVGDTLVATVDGIKPIAGAHEALAAQKTNFGFTVSGETIAIRNLRVWEATAKPNATELKEKLISATPKAPAGGAAAAGKGRRAK
jgi:hypothetical protein